MTETSANKSVRDLRRCLRRVMRRGRDLLLRRSTTGLAVRVFSGARALFATSGASPHRGVASLDLRERRRLERDLHDGAQQRLVSLSLTLRMARERLDSDPGETGRLLDRSRDELDQALTELRELGSGIQPAVLADRGLGAAVEALAERAPLPVYVVTDLPDRRLPERVELAAYFVVSEALTNVAKYASATQASVAVTERKGRLVVEVGDDGVGGADVAGGTGLRGLSDRLAAVDGRFEVDSKPGHGTTVRAVLPCLQPTAHRRLGARVGAPPE
jgi:signal transduction histidine kinase